MPLRIFLIEDSKRIRDDLTVSLEELVQAEIVGFAQGEGEAKVWLAANQAGWDLAVIDLFLREGSGLGVLDYCKSTQPSRRACVISNYATPDIRRRCLELRADAVFDKSTELDEFFSFCDNLPPS
jgi:two-component system OmpR family response regulator